MLKRHRDKAPQITFTSDYHELLSGDLRPGAPLSLRYDPQRLDPPSTYVFGDPRWPIRAHLRFRGAGPVDDVPLTGPVTPLPDRDPMGQGSMLTGKTSVPADAQFVELWVSGGSPGDTRWDSDYGANYWFRFPYADVEVVSAEVRPPTPGASTATFAVAVTTAPEVTRVLARFADATARAQVKLEGELTKGAVRGGRREWNLAEPVQPSALPRFKLYYWVAGRRFKDDNSGAYYLADREDTRERVPEPPRELLAAHKAWSERLRRLK